MSRTNGTATKHYQKRRRKKKQYRPNATKIIRTKQWVYDFSKIVLLGLILFGVIMTFRCNYYMERSKLVEGYVDSLYEEDSVSDLISLSKIEDKMTKITDNYKLSKERYLDLKIEYDELDKKLDSLINDIVLLDYENIQLVEANDNYYEELSTYKEREELFDKYEYAIINNNTRTDITYDQLKTGIDIMEQNGNDPNILWGVIMTESKGDEKAKNATSTATGYGQVLRSTAKSTYEKYMNNGPGTFDPEMLSDGITNIEITANYLNQLIENSGSLTEALYEYRGLEDKAWLNSVDKYCKEGGTSIKEINREIYN